MKHPFLKFFLTLTILVILIFCLHLFVLNTLQLSLFADKIVLAYLFNYLLALAIYGALYYLRNRLKNQLGFIFMGGSLLKFLLFFLLFYKSYRADGTIETHEFAAFFVPYAACLIIETTALVNLLKKLD